MLFQVHLAWATQVVVNATTIWSQPGRPKIHIWKSQIECVLNVYCHIIDKIVVDEVEG
jgi:hypothetical protein